jgi:IS605 OrfB family transposase
MKVKNKKGEELAPSPEEKKDRRIMLALSWLSVESETGAPSKYFVQNDLDTKNGKRNNWKTVDALKEILKVRGVSETDSDQWLTDCAASLSAAIRDDAVWVNRSKAFGGLINSKSFTQDDIWDFLSTFFSGPEAYLKPIKGKSTDGGEDNDETEGLTDKDEKIKDLVQKAGGWLSSRCGTGKGADFSKMHDVYEGIAKWAETATGKQDAIADLAVALSKFDPVSNDLQGVLGIISGPGYKSGTRTFLNKINDQDSISRTDLDALKKKAEDDAKKCNSKTGTKGSRDYSDKILGDVASSCGFTYLQNDGPARHAEYSVMLDHAARRVSLVHTWIKRAEAERRKFEEDAREINNISKEAKERLDRFCKERSSELGALEGYRIRRRAVDGWKEVVKAWSKADCKTEDDRLASARTLQDNPEIDKFGDIQLFEALASDDAKCVWQINGKSDPQPLLDYVAAKDAEDKKQRFKVPAYCHPDTLLHPVFCDFGNSRWDIIFNVHEAKKNKDKKRNNATEDTDIHNLKMGLWTGTTVEEISLRWQSKRLFHDLALTRKDSHEDSITDVSRADRLGRAAGKAKTGAVAIKSVFDQKEWNGRLQAPRSQLDAIAKVRDNISFSIEVKKRRIDKLVSNIKWFITFSPKLQPQGPWFDYIDKTTDKSPFERIYKSGAKKGQSYVSFTGWPHEMENNDRSGMAKHLLSRLPGLRVLSVDLGHRHAAACAVWEMLTKEQIEAACNAANVQAPGEADLYLHHKNNNRTTIYRRIGSDYIEEADKSTGEIKNVPNLTSWARLDRQFLIKLQGEESNARKATSDEIKAIRKLESELGYIRQDEYSLQVDELMSFAVNIVRLALRRHGDKARVAHCLITNEKTKPGGLKEKLDRNGRVEVITDALELWHGLAASKRWQDTEAENLWRENFPEVPITKKDDEEKTRQQIKKEKKVFRENTLKPMAEKLYQNNMKLHVVWVTRWREDDANWQKRLRWLRDWILPRGSRANDKTIRHVGGLSLTRIATIKSLNQVQKAFFARLKPDGTHETAKEGFGQSVLDTLENMREQRVKQLASRIAEAALGIGRIKISKKGKTPKRPCEQVDDSCHAVVIENLTHYRPEETRTRRENRQLMQWSSAKVKKYLSEACQLHGLHLREVSAGYTSRQDSRTGAPGIRCEDVPVDEFIKSPFWIKEIKRAENKDDAQSKYFSDLKEKYATLKEDERKKAHPLRIPLRGGEIFVSADSRSPASKGIQADLNAAANIGLKALLDPDWQGRWWYVPCDSKEYKPIKDKVSGSKAFDNVEALKKTTTGEKGGNSSEKKKRKRVARTEKSKEVVNLWRDVSSEPLTKGDWQEYSAYKNKVQYNVIRYLRRQAGLPESHD